MAFVPVQIFSLGKPCTPPVVQGFTFAPDTEFGNGLWVATVDDADVADELVASGGYSRIEIEELKAAFDAVTFQTAAVAASNDALTAAVAATAGAEATVATDNASVAAALADKTTKDAATAAALTAKGSADSAYAGAHALGLLTSDGTAPADGETATLDSKVYTFKTALTPTEGEVLIGATTDASAALANLKAAVNHTGTPGTDYSCAAVHPTISAGALTSTTLAFTAKTAGPSGDALATTETSAHLSFGGTTLLRDAGLASAASAADSAYTTALAASNAADTAYSDAVAAASTDAGPRDTDRTAQTAASLAYAKDLADLAAIKSLVPLGTRATGKRNPFFTQEVIETFMSPPPPRGGD